MPVRGNRKGERQILSFPMHSERRYGPPEQSAIRSTIGTAAIRHILKTNGIVPDPDGDCPAGGVRVLEDAQLPIPTG